MARNRQYYDPTSFGVSALASATEGNVINVSDFRHAVISLGTASSANMTIKFLGAIGDTAPDFSSAQSATNRWQTLDFALTNNGGTITDGDTGIVFSGTDGNQMVNINTDGLDYLVLSVTARSAGSVTADCGLFANS